MDREGEEFQERCIAGGESRKYEFLGYVPPESREPKEMHDGPNESREFRIEMHDGSLRVNLEMLCRLI